MSAVENLKGFQRNIDKEKTVMKKKLIAMLAAMCAAMCTLASVTISVSTKTVQKTGGGGTITVSGTGAWTAVSDASWITVKSGASGDGDGKVMFTVGENTTADTRIGHINITGGNVYTITQYGYTGTISPSSTTCDLNGEAGTINITVDAGITWSATPNVEWLSVTPTSGRSVGSVTYTVAPYNGVVSRSGSITIAGQTFNVTQTGVDVSIEPKVIKLAPEADIIQITVTALAGTKWVVTPGVSWISILDKEQGYGDYVLTLAVNANPSFARRTGNVAIGTATLTVIQNGKETAELAIDPETATASPSGAFANVAVYATPDAPWTAQSLTPWITISQGQEGAGNGNIKYVASANPALSEREGIIKITPPYKEPDIDLYAGLACRIPSFASKRGNPQRYFLMGDSTEWSSAAQTDIQKACDTWLNLESSTCTVDTGTTWDGCSSTYFGRSNYMTTKISGPGTLTFWWRAASDYSDIQLRVSVDGSERAGTRAGWSKVSVSIPDNGNHSIRWRADSGYTDSYGTFRYNGGNVDFIGWESTAESIRFDGTSACCLNGAAFTTKESDDFTASIAFSIGELDRVNRLMTLAGRSVYLNDDNRLVFHETPTDFVVDSANTFYTLLIRQDADHNLSLYAGGFGTELACVLEMPYSRLLDFSQNVTTDFLKLGYTGLPTPGFLTSGNMKEFRFWIRALTDEEAEKADAMSDALVDAAPKYAPSGSAWNYFPMDGNMFSTASATLTPALKGNACSYMNEFDNRYGIRQRALESKTDGNIFIDDMRALFGNTEASATYSLWFYVDKLPASGSTSLMKRYWSGTASYASGDGIVEVSVLPNGGLQLNNNGSMTSYSSHPILEKRWYMLTLVGVATRALQVYLDDVEIGNVSSGTTLGYKAWSSYGNATGFMRGVFGGGACAIDDLVIYHQALTSAQVRELYEASKAKVVYHTVLQGIQTAQLSEERMTVVAAGDNRSVQLTLAQNVNWDAIENCDWIHITSDTEGAGSATIAFTIDSNPLVVNRTGTLTIAGVTLTVEQIGLEADVTPEKTFFDSVDSDMSFIYVWTEGAGQWTAVSNDDWIQIDPDTEDGNGAGTCWFYIDDYPLTTQSRTGSITIAGKTVFITQCGYKLSIEPSIAEVGSNAGAGEIGVAASIDQVWEVISDCDWITIVNGRSGIGNGKVQYQFTDNTTGETRTGTIIIGGQKYTLTQRTTLPLTTAAIGNGTISGSGNYNQGSSVTLTATPQAGYVFSHWQGDAVGVSNQVTVAMDVAKNVSAVFIPESAAEQLAAAKAAQGGFYTRDQIHALEVGNLVLDVDAASGTARVGVQLMETSDLSDPNSWRPVGMSTGNLDVGSDGTVGLNVPATGNAKFFKVVVPQK